ncbi:MAG TPA: hypothetical protein PKN36_11270, partial [bacterium]|nr:hypothetical protein [bacterium]
MRIMLMGSALYRKQVALFINVVKSERLEYSQLPTISTRKNIFPPVLAAYIMKKDMLLEKNFRVSEHSLSYSLFLSEILSRISEGSILHGAELVEFISINIRGKEFAGISREDVIFDLSYGALQFLAFFGDDASRDLFRITMGLAKTSLENMRRDILLEHLQHFRVHAAVFLASESEKQEWSNLHLKANSILESWGDSPANLNVVTHCAHNLYIFCNGLPETDRAYDIIRRCREEYKQDKGNAEKLIEVLNKEVGWREASSIMRILWPDFNKPYYRHNLASVKEIALSVNIEEAKKWAVDNRFVSAGGIPYIRDRRDFEPNDWYLWFPGGYTIGNTSVLCKAKSVRVLFDYGCDN